MSSSNLLKIRPTEHFSADLTVPGDKSISHRAAIIAGLANGPCLISNYLASEDCLNTLRAMERLGVSCEYSKANQDGPMEVMVHGTSMGLSSPSSTIDCGNSGTGMRLLAGILAGQKFESTLTGDDSLCSRPMGRIIKPLERMGAQLEATGKTEGCAPLVFQGRALNSIHYIMPVASAQVKSAVLLAGLFAQGKTTVEQPSETRDHTERMLSDFGIQLGFEGNKISIEGGQIPKATNLDVPGDISSAAFWLVAAAAREGSRLKIRKVGLNPTRTAVVNVLLRMGAKIQETATSQGEGEPTGDLEVHGSELHGTDISGKEIPNLIDEIPILAVAGALARGTMTIRDAGELRVKESDRIRTVVDNLLAMGANVTEHDDGMTIEGGVNLHGASLDCFGDHRIAMAFSIAGLFAEGETVILNTECIATSYPGFEEDLRRVGGIRP
ncbi:MAG TPA: 3-phosphoshikimate 1-carboxyvinyltransferase [Verrucomicrobiales bacterium]|nr:3-phosphoshikimate 1-carboxyvinyltransferase [Verrucomicrobiales bacterium]